MAFKIHNFGGFILVYCPFDWLIHVESHSICFELVLDCAVVVVGVVGDRIFESEQERKTAKKKEEILIVSLDCSFHFTLFYFIPVHFASFRFVFQSSKDMSHETAVPASLASVAAGRRASRQRHRGKS